ncbi:unnamed protein product [Spodoptera littoralis]|uniref:Regulatory protein zeste n=1 Tax=Spodoptera littoralis TaxID=7109 RepID=A0A9P0I1E7_SPOLI|nr:unnamed protein product [Spodoptera littoralis]CAH1637275.1 unnamed protein product [Spodoptera littoralis]
MESRVRASPEQFATLLEYMETHGDLARPVAGPQGRLRSDRLWAELTNILNAVGGGVSKTTDKWKKVWADWKSKTKKKALTIRHHARGTGGGPASGQNLSATDERMLAIMGPLAVTGQVSVEELGFNRPLNTAQEDPVAQDDPVTQDNSVFLEILDDTPQLNTLSPQPSTSQPSNNWLPPSTPSPLPLVLTQTSTQGRQPVAPAPPATPTTAAPSPPTRAEPTTPRRRRLPAPRTSAISPSTRRRPRLRSPATPQSAASPDRPRLRARRRQAPTPFERAASEFTAVELRRLELEEVRTRQQHERDMRALEVEHERNQVFSSIVNVAQAWLDYFRSRDNTERLNTE